MTDREVDANRLSAQSYARGEPSGWFETLYSEAARGDAVVPWDRGTPVAQLVEWFAGRGASSSGSGKRAVVVGCGLGRDSEYLAGLGYTTTAFDLSETAVRTARERHPGTKVTYVAADLLDLPDAWLGGFELVVESYTVQSVPEPPRAALIAQVGRLVAPGGTLVVIAAANDSDELATEGPPFPLTRAEVDAFAVGGIEPVRVERPVDGEGVARWVAEFRRP